MASAAAYSDPTTDRIQRPTDALLNTQSTSNVIASVPGDQATAGKKRRNHRAGKKKKARRQSFAVPGDESGNGAAMRSSQELLEQSRSTGPRPPFYRLGQSGGRNLSETSLDSEMLLDHRDHPPMRTRRESRILPSAFGARPGQINNDIAQHASNEGQYRRPRHTRGHVSPGGESEGDGFATHDRTPLLSNLPQDAGSGYGLYSGQGRGVRYGSPKRRNSTTTSTSSRRRRRMPSRQPSASSPHLGHDVNNPPSVPGSPKLGPDMGYDDVMVTGSFAPRAPEDRRSTAPALNEHLIDIDGDDDDPPGSPPSTAKKDSMDRRRTVALSAEEDVCFPVEGMSQIAEEDYMARGQGTRDQSGQRRRRFRQWPDLSVLADWRREEKEERSEGIRAKKISEPVLVGGRLRPQKNGWHRAEEDAPYRFTYFNEEFPSTIHSHTISELLQPGQSFKDLFIPNPPELSDESSDEDDLMSHQGYHNERQELSPHDQSRAGTRQSSILGEMKTMSPKQQTPERSGQATPVPSNDQQKEKSKRYGSRPTFWLDVLSPTDTEMRVISKTFGIHPLTAEDIMMQEAREKVELFRNYYLVNYRTFEQDMNSEDFLEPVNMYVVVFRDGVISFHFSMTPHPANVRRRIRQLKDYLILSSDWISYAIIDDITDVFAPLIQSIENEVDDIDDAILQLHSGGKDEPGTEKVKASKNNEARSESGEQTSTESGGDMLRRVGEGRKKVMGLYRLLGNKADVIKGFAKRCNEQWEIAPRSEIGLYLGDIQDHILTMTGNLSHYETFVDNRAGSISSNVDLTRSLLSRAHSNYLAQINIRMNERQEQTADVLGKLTVLGTIVLPMNIITGMWGMNVLVPGQDVDNLYWFWSISAGLVLFGVSCFFIAKRVYGIV
ncbi:CorA metal ion transporter [Pseudocyphellaria aurata]|nr:CorA metal ion transporter [Pseudocyphellaria aurata]